MFTLSVHCITFRVSLYSWLMAIVQVRIDDPLKKAAQKILADVGLDLSSAIKIYLKKIVARKGIPFEVITENGLTPRQEKAILKAAEEAKRGINVSKPMTGDEFLSELKKLSI